MSKSFLLFPPLFPTDPLPTYLASPPSSDHVRIMRKADSQLFERHLKAEKNCRKHSRQLKDHKRKCNDRMEHACAKIRKTNERDKLVAVSDATVELQDELKKSVRGAECLKRNVVAAKVRYPNPCPFIFIPIAYIWCVFLARVSTIHCCKILQTARAKYTN